MVLGLLLIAGLWISAWRVNGFAFAASIILVLSGFAPLVIYLVMVFIAVMLAIVAKNRLAKTSTFSSSSSSIPNLGAPVTDDSTLPTQSTIGAPVAANTSTPALLGPPVDDDQT